VDSSFIHCVDISTEAVTALLKWGTLSESGSPPNMTNPPRELGNSNRLREAIISHNLETVQDSR